MIGENEKPIEDGKTDSLGKPMKNNYFIILVIATIGFFTIAVIDTYNRNKPPVVPEKEVAKYVAEMFKKDSVVNLPIRYKFHDQKFESNGDTTYWFFIADIREKNQSGQNTACIKLPYSHFDFDSAYKYIQKKNDFKLESIFITYFTQVSQASYESYHVYAKLK